MVKTRSNNTKAKKEKMTTPTEEWKCYFKKLIEPSLEELFNKLKVMKKSRSKMLKLKNSNRS